MGERAKQLSLRKEVNRENNKRASKQARMPDKNCFKEETE